MEPPLYTPTEPILLPYFPRLFYLALRDQGFEDEQIFEGMDLVDPGIVPSQRWKPDLERSFPDFTDAQASGYGAVARKR